MRDELDLIIEKAQELASNPDMREPPSRSEFDALCAVIARLAEEVKADRRALSNEKTYGEKGWG